MRKLHFVLVLLILSSYNLLGQNSPRTTIIGTVCDTSGINISYAMALLLSTKDSTLVYYTQTDEKGAFEFKNVKNNGYLLKIQHMSFLPYQKRLPVALNNLTDIGRIQLKIISKVLLEVVIKAARAPLKFFGDTIEYDAASFKVPPGSTVEDLLRRLPGIDVDVEGNIKAQGKDVKRLYVDGKTFFGNDPKYATKNLGAEIISKVQFFDEKSDQSRLSGIEDTRKDTKAMNLSLKEEFKQGAFGKVTVAAGDQERWAFRGNYNRFDKKQMLSFIGFGNNINQTGVDIGDYIEYKGQSISNSNMGDYGGSHNFRYLDLSSGLMNYYDGRGLTDNYGGGVNYNLDNKKTKISSSYSYNETTRTLFQTSNKETFLQSGSFKNADTTQSKEFRGIHNIGICLEQKIDTANTLIAKVFIDFSTSRGNVSLNSFYSDTSDIKNRTLNIVNDNKINAWNVRSAAIYNHQFKKKGANFMWSGGINSVRSNELDNPFSINRFFEANTFTDQVRELNTRNDNTTTQFKTSMLLTEPISKNIKIQAYYNFNTTRSIQDKLTLNTAMQNNRVDSLTAWYANDALFNCAGTTIYYNNKGFNAQLGVAAQQIQLKGRYSLRNDLPYLKDPMNKTYSNLLPNIFLSYQITKSATLNASYSKDIGIPSMEQLMPIVDVNNPAFIIEGNPDLQPDRSDNYRLSYSSYNQTSMSNIYAFINYRGTKNAISDSRTIRMVDNVGMQTVTRWENVKGFNHGTDAYASYGFPLIRSKLIMNTTGRFGFGNSPTLINAIENVAKNTSYSLGTNFNLTLSKKLLFGLSGNINSNDIRNSLQNDLNQKIRSYSSNSSVKWQITTKTHFDCNFSYSVYKNASFGFNRNIPLLNASIRQIIGKANRIELRLSAFDILDKNLNISQQVTEFYVVNTTANTLARYFMLSFSYNIKGFDLKTY